MADEAVKDPKLEKAIQNATLLAKAGSKAYFVVEAKPGDFKAVSGERLKELKFPFKDPRVRFCTEKVEDLIKADEDAAKPKADAKKTTPKAAAPVKPAATKPGALPQPPGFKDDEDVSYIVPRAYYDWATEHGLTIGQVVQALVVFHGKLVASSGEERATGQILALSQKNPFAKE